MACWLITLSNHATYTKMMCMGRNDSVCVRHSDVSVDKIVKGMSIID